MTKIRIVGSVIDSVMVTLSWPPFTPTLWTPPMGARQTAVAVMVSGGVRTVPSGARTVVKVGVRLPEVGLRCALKPDASVCAQVMVGAVALGSCVRVPARVSVRPGATEKSMPALTIGKKPPAAEQVTGVGAGLPGHGVSWPTTVLPETPNSGPEPCARKGISWKLLGMIGSPSLWFSGKMKSKLGNRY